jgi:hypothetical protein
MVPRYMMKSKYILVIYIFFKYRAPILYFAPGPQKLRYGPSACESIETQERGYTPFRVVLLNHSFHMIPSKFNNLFNFIDAFLRSFTWVSAPGFSRTDIVIANDAFA